MEKKVIANNEKKSVVFMSVSKSQIANLAKHLKSCDFDVEMCEETLSVSTDVKFYTIVAPTTKQKYLKVEAMQYANDNYLDNVIMVSSNKTTNLVGVNTARNLTR
ncbi:MAG: hypothetical protein ACLRFE_02540 [Clostridia bacterium]